MWGEAPNWDGKSQRRNRPDGIDVISKAVKLIAVVDKLQRYLMAVARETVVHNTFICT